MTLDKLHNAPIISLAYSHDGNFFLSGAATKTGNDVSALKRNVPELKEIKTIDHKERSILVFGIEEKQVLHEFKEIHKETVTEILITKDDQYGISSSVDKSIKVFSLKKYAVIHTIQNCHDNFILYITISPRSILSSVGFDKIG